MKLLIATGIYPPDSGGPATYSKLIFDELPKLGGDTMDQSVNEKKQKLQQPIETKVLTFGEVRYLLRVVRHCAYFFLLLKRAVGCDIVYAQDPVSVGFPAWAAARLLRKTFLLKVVGDYAWEQGVQQSGVKENLDEFVERMDYPFFVRILRRVESFTARHADTVIVPSNYLKKIVMTWGVSESKVRVIYNAFEAPMLGKKKEEVRAELGIGGHVLLSASRLVPWKGMPLLITLMPELLKEFPDLTLHIVGDGPERTKLEHLIEALHLQKSVKLLGQLPHDKTLEYIFAADIFALNTSYEGLSHFLLEAMALGTPVITTAVGGNIELIRNGQEGILVGYNDRIELKKAIIKLFSDPLCAQDHAANARKKVAGFSTKKMLGELAALLRASKPSASSAASVSAQ